MDIASVIILLLLSKTYQCRDIKQFFETINKDYAQFSAISAKIAWDSSVDPDDSTLQTRSADSQKNRLIWQKETCDNLAGLYNRKFLNSTQKRQTYLLCRGPKFTYNEVRRMSALYEQLQSIYSDAEICIPVNQNISRNDLPTIEDAILKYLSTVKELAKNNSILFPAQIAASGMTPKNALCFKGEDDIDKLMTFSRKEEVLRWLWLVWREKVGPPMREPYRKFIYVQNLAAKRNGYTNIGPSWRDELEIHDLRKLCQSLYDSIRPMYTLLHGVVRFYLRKYYGEVVPERGAIPAHLLGNLWSQNWEPLADLIFPKSLNLDESIMKLNWTVLHMVKRAEDFYQSLGLPAMTDTFWKHSIFARENRNTHCHGTAADMFKDGDFRLLYCAGTKKEDFYVLHHELGHIQYYMAYKHQPAIFRQANAALQETIGDTIMVGVMTPQQLHRLGLINDSALYGTNYMGIPKYTDDIVELSNEHDNLIDRDIKTEKSNFKQIYSNFESHYSPDVDPKEYNNNDRILYEDEGFSKATKQNNVNESIVKSSVDVSIDDILLLRQALNKLPQIPFSILIDKYRWKYFEGSLKNVNGDFWKMALELQGIAPPGVRGERYFDVGSIYHVPDNTPYIRYFLSSFLQHQLFETLCKGAVFGRRNVDETLPKTISMHRCDIYGSRTVGKILKDLMSRGNSQNWRDILEATTGQRDINAAALERYYRPLFKLLEKLVHAHRIPIGW